MLIGSPTENLERIFSRDLDRRFMTDSRGKLADIYRSEHDGVRPAHDDSAAAGAYYADYADFMAAVAPAGGKLLDIGCGGGWSTALFADRGYDAVGIDLAPDFALGNAPGRRFARADATALPFADGSFDAAGIYQTLEHAADPERLLWETLRVLKPGGVFAIVGPNLLSLGASVVALTKWVWKNRPARRILFRDGDLPRHPFGNTLPEVVSTMAGNAGRIARRSLARKPVLQMREPDLRPPFHSDNDACFVCNPLDLAKFFRAHGCEIIQNGKPGRPAVTRMLASGTFLAVRKAMPR
jgi:SAM-dependent methyltransferase